MKKTILLTRPLAASQRLRAPLEQRGFDCVIEPLLTIEPTHAPCPVGDFQAVLITSANAPDILRESKEQITDILSLPCFCVGVATGEAAREAGFTDIRCGAADGASLAHLVAETLQDKTGNLLHIAGEITSGKMQEILREENFTVTHWPLYRAIAAEGLSPHARELLANGKINAIPVFSPRSAQILVSLIEKNRLTQACSSIIATGLSQEVGNVLEKLPWHRLRIAAKPEEGEMISCLQSELAMVENETLVTPADRRTCPRKTGFAFRCLIGLLALAAIFCVALFYDAGRPVLPVFPVIAQGGVDDLKHRVEILENKIEALNAAAPAPQTEPSDTEALNKSIRNLEARVTQIEKQNGQNQQGAQKLIAVAFAFQDLREAAQSGQNFTPQLVNLRAVAGDDAVILEQTAKLDPYAAQGAPSYAQLRDSLTAAEQKTSASAENPDAGWQAQVKSALQSLISVRPLHDIRFAALEKALEDRDGATALTALKNLPPDVQQNLATWQEKLNARLTIDEAIEKLSAHFAALPDQGNTP